MLQQSDLSLATAISKCRAKEAVKQQRAEITDRSQSISALHRSAVNRQMTNATIPCQGCGAKPHSAGFTQCPVYNVTCFHCQKVGNFAKVCRSKSLRKHASQPPVPELFQ